MDAGAGVLRVSDGARREPMKRIQSVCDNCTDEETIAWKDGAFHAARWYVCGRAEEKVHEGYDVPEKCPFRLEHLMRQDEPC
jgi:hypothetical protein